MPLAEPRDEDVKTQIGLIEDFDRERSRQRTKKRREFFRALCEARLNREFGLPGQDDRTVGVKHYAEVTKKTGYTQQAPEHLLDGVIEMLRDYYHPDAIAGRETQDTVRIAFRASNFCPVFSSIEQLPIPAKLTPNDSLDVFRREFHRYHLTLDDRGPFWIYTTLDFQERVDEFSRSAGVWNTPYLKGSAPLLNVAVLDPKQRAELENKNTFNFEARLAGAHLVVHLQRPRPGSDIAIELFPFADSDTPKDEYFGTRINQTWENPATVVSSIVMLSHRPIEGLEDLERGRVPAEYDQTLRLRWEKGSKVRRLPDIVGEIQVHQKFPDQQINDLISKSKELRLSVTWLPQLDPWKSSFEKALEAGASITILLSHPDSAFAQLRSMSAVGDSRIGRKLIIHNRELLIDLKRRWDKLTPKLTDRLLPVSYIEIDDSIYFSGLWFGKKSSDGIWLSTPKDSSVGSFLVRQFEDLLKTSIDDDLTQFFASNESMGEMALLDRLVHHTWTGTMQDVYRDDKTPLPEPEEVNLTFQKQQNDLVGGLLHIERKDNTSITVVLRNCHLRDRHLSFACENKDPAVRHVGVILMEVDDPGDDLSGFYLGWSPSSQTHHCRKVQLKKVESGRGPAAG